MVSHKNSSGRLNCTGFLNEVMKQIHKECILVQLNNGKSFVRAIQSKETD